MLLPVEVNRNEYNRPLFEARREAIHVHCILTDTTLTAALFKVYSLCGYQN